MKNGLERDSSLRICLLLQEGNYFDQKNNFKILHQLIKSTKLYDWNPGFFDSEDGSGPKHCPEFLVLTINSQRLQLPSGSLLIIILAVTDRSSMPVRFSQSA